MSRLGFFGNNLLMQEGKLVYTPDPCDCCCCYGSATHRVVVISGVPDVGTGRFLTDAPDCETSWCSDGGFPAPLRIKNWGYTLTGLSALNGTWSIPLQVSDCQIPIASVGVGPISSTVWSGSEANVVLTHSYIGSLAIDDTELGIQCQLQRGPCQFSATTFPGPNGSVIGPTAGTATLQNLAQCYSGIFNVPFVTDHTETRVGSNPTMSIPFFCRDVSFTSSSTKTDITIETFLV